MLYVITFHLHNCVLKEGKTSSNYLLWGQMNVYECDLNQPPYIYSSKSFSKTPQVLRTMQMLQYTFFSFTTGNIQKKVLISFNYLEQRK